MGDYSPLTRVVPRAITLQIVEGGEVDVHHATLIWDAVLPSGKIVQQYSTVDLVIDPPGASNINPSIDRQAVRRLLWRSIQEVLSQQGF